MANRDRKTQDSDPKKKKIYPETETNTPKPDDTTMSSGNLVNNPSGRTKSRSLHSKISVTGNDDDGQAT